MDNEELMEELRKMAEANKKKETAVGTVMKNGGGAVAGGTVGWYVGAGIGAALAPFTGGVSIAVAPIIGAVVAGGLGHKMSKDID